MENKSENKDEVKTYIEDTHGVLSIQDALIILGVYAANIDPDHCEEDVRQIVGLAQQLPEFIEISEDKKSTEKRIFLYMNRLQNPVQVKETIDQAVRVVAPDMKKRAIDWMVQICDTLGLREARMNKLNEIEVKLKG